LAGQLRAQGGIEPLGFHTPTGLKPVPTTRQDHAHKSIKGTINNYTIKAFAVGVIPVEFFWHGITLLRRRLGSTTHNSSCSFMRKAQKNRRRQERHPNESVFLLEKERNRQSLSLQSGEFPQEACPPRKEKERVLGRHATTILLCCGTAGRSSKAMAQPQSPKDNNLWLIVRR